MIKMPGTTTVKATVQLLTEIETALERRRVLFVAKGVVHRLVRSSGSSGPSVKIGVSMSAMTPSSSRL